MKKYLILFFLLLAACAEQPSPPSYTTIFGRGKRGEKRPPLYQISLPEGWKISEVNGPFEDTTVPIFACDLNEDGSLIRLTLHNFPAQIGENKIPPKAQLERWKKQFSSLSFSDEQPQSFAGFIGMFLQAEGQMHAQNTTLFAWALQVSPENERSFYFFPSKAKEEMCCDVTIKVIGPSDMMDLHRQEIYAMARSLEQLFPFPML